MNSLNESFQVNRVTVSVNLNCSWNDLQMIITKVTVNDFKKISDKLQSFFKVLFGSPSSVVINFIFIFFLPLYFCFFLKGAVVKQSQGLGYKR